MQYSQTFFLSCALMHISTSLAMWTLLHESIYKKNIVATTKTILARPDLINQADRSHWTPLHWAAFTGQPAIVELLINHNAKVQDLYDDNTPLHLAAINGHLDAVRILLEHGATDNHKNSHGQTPLSLASLRHYEEIVFLINTYKNRKRLAFIESATFARILHPRLGAQTPACCVWIVRLICEYLQP